MAWTAPRTFVTGELVTASHLNANIRDNSRVLYNSSLRMGGAQTSRQRSVFTEEGTSFTPVSVADLARIVIPDAKAILDEGFTPQIRMAGFLKNSATNFTVFRAVIEEVADGHVASTLISSGTVPEISSQNQNGANAYVWRDSGWQDHTVTPGTDPDWIVVPQARVSANTGSYLNVFMGFRWSSRGLARGTSAARQDTRAGPGAPPRKGARPTRTRTMIRTPDTRAARLETQGPAAVVVVEHEGAVLLRSNARRAEWPSLLAWINANPKRAALYALAVDLAGPPGTRRPDTLARLVWPPKTTDEIAGGHWSSTMGAPPGSWPLEEEPAGWGVRDDGEA